MEFCWRQCHPLLHYIKLIEVLSYIKTEILSAIRDASAELVVEGILSKKRMKMYFSSLPCSSSTALPTAAMDLKDYTLITLVKLFNDDKDDESSSYLPVNAQDIDSALREMLPSSRARPTSPRQCSGSPPTKNWTGARKRNPWITAPNGSAITFPEFAESPRKLGRTGSRFWGTPCCPLSLPYI